MGKRDQRAISPERLSAAMARSQELVRQTLTEKVVTQSGSAISSTAAGIGPRGTAAKK